MLNRRRKTIFDMFISTIVIAMLVTTLYGFYAAGSVRLSSPAEAAFGFTDGAVTVTPANVPHSASDEGVPSSINRFGSSTTNTVYIPTRTSQRAAGSLLLADAGAVEFALSFERLGFTANAPEFTPFLYVKTTHKRE